MTLNSAGHFMSETSTFNARHIMCRVIVMASMRDIAVYLAEYVYTYKICHLWSDPQRYKLNVIPYDFDNLHGGIKQNKSFT